MKYEITLLYLEHKSIINVDSLSKKKYVVHT